MFNNRSRSLVLVVMAALAVYAVAAATGWQKVSALAVTAPVSPAPLPLLRKQQSQVAEEPVETPKTKDRIVFTIYRTADGEIACREATAAERREMERTGTDDLGLQPINHPELKHRSLQSTVNSATGLTIVLRGTQQLQQNPTASAAFIAAAQHWEALIKSPITVYIDVDYGTTNFGQTWGANVLGATHAPIASYPYDAVRTNLNAEAAGEGNAAKLSVFGALPSGSVPTDLGPAISAAVSEAQARAIGLLPADAQTTDPAPRIAFNANVTFDFDPSDGITSGQTDFDAVATHEMGHALGFTSENGTGFTRPSIWDLFRFRSGTTTETFTTRARIMTIGGAFPNPDPFHYYFVPGNSELALSSGGPNSNAQSSHWRGFNGCAGYIGIMTPSIPSGCRRTITSSDILALAHFGYNLTNSVAPPPAPPLPTPPANDNFANAQVMPGCSGATTANTFRATREPGEPSHTPGDNGSLSPGHTIWFRWQPSASGGTVIKTKGSDFDTILAIYTGNSINALTRVEFNDDVQPGLDFTSSVPFIANGGTTYWVAIDGYGDDRGRVQLDWLGCGLNPTPTPTPTPTSTPTPSPSPTPTPSPSPSGTPALAFSPETYVVNEGAGTATITLIRGGNISSASSVSYRTTDNDTFTVNCANKVGNAFARCDFATAVGTFNFAPGETSKTITIPIINDGYAEGIETFSVMLLNPVGASLGITPTAYVTITDNETSDGPNPILMPSVTGIGFFVRQHYLDFLGREPEVNEPWTAVLNGCTDQFNTNPGSPSGNCDRIFASGSFFGSPEFKDKGFYIIGMYRGAFNRLPTYLEFSFDLASISGATAAEVFAKRAAYANSFVQKGEFTGIYNPKSNADYVNHLMTGGQGQNYNLTSIMTRDPANPDTGSKVTLTTAELISRLTAGTMTRAQVLRAIAQSDEIVLNKEAVNSFVASQYYGYLRRTPDTGGFNGWVNYLRANPNDFRTMVHGFLDSTEYRSRFGGPQ